MKLSRIFLAMAAVAVFATTAPAAHLDNPNLLRDPSFEGAITTDGPPFVGSWEGFSAGGATSDFTTNNPRTGAQSLELNIVGEASVFAGAFQDVVFDPSLAGTAAWYSGWHSLVGDTGGSEIRIEWRDSVNDAEISRTQITDSPVGSGYEEFIISDTIPAGADSARIVYAIQSFGGALFQQVFVDDVNFNITGVVPEPTSLALAGLGGLALVGLRRRSA